jgi:hypothetical protein
MVPQGVSAIVDQALGSTIALDERSNTVGATPAIRPLTAGVGAVDPTSSWPVDVDDGLAARRAFVTPDDIAHQMDLLHGRDSSTHAPIMTTGCHSHDVTTVRPEARAHGPLLVNRLGLDELVPRGESSRRAPGRTGRVPSDAAAPPARPPHPPTETIRHDAKPGCETIRHDHQPEP